MTVLFHSLDSIVLFRKWNVCYSLRANDVECQNQTEHYYFFFHFWNKCIFSSNCQQRLPFTHTFTYDTFFQEIIRISFQLTEETRVTKLKRIPKIQTIYLCLLDILKKSFSPRKKRALNNTMFFLIQVYLYYFLCLFK